MNMNYKLIPITEDDYEFVYKLKKNAYKEYVEFYWGTWDETAQREYFKRFIDKYKDTTYLIQLGDSIIGFYNDDFLENDDYEIGNICIAPEYQGKGIGTKILKDIIDKYSDKNIHIQYFKINPVGNLYERLGFVMDGETETHYKMIKLVKNRERISRVNLYLKQLSVNDGIKELEFLRKVPEYENGFYNPASEEDLINETIFQAWLKRKYEESNSINLEEGCVPQTIYWVMNGDKIVGVGKLRHYLNEKLLKSGGHIGLGILSEFRDKGVGTEALKFLIREAETLGIENILLTNDEDNYASRKIVEKCGGVLDSIDNGKCKYWIDLRANDLLLKKTKDKG